MTTTIRSLNEKRTEILTDLDGLRNDEMDTTAWTSRVKRLVEIKAELKRLGAE
jgi:hypothetical protein